MWFPLSCARCRRPGASPCIECRAQLSAAPDLPTPHGLDSCTALLAYDDVARPLITAVKYRNARTSLATLAPVLASLAPVTGASAVVTWAPTTPQRRRQRGFDHAELLASAVARRLRRPRRALLRRAAGAPQTGRSRLERLEGPRFEASGRAPLEVVLVDDVCTTGSTLGAAAAVLRAAGADVVHALVLARTPETVAA
jgi:predicted amidophosphoribosyltransferase